MYLVNNSTRSDDVSKAFGRVWREELMFAASPKGLPIPFVRWLRDFLSNRTARVQINGERGDSAPLRQGLPQGAVLSPLPFLLYIDDLRAVVPETVKVALFADKGQGLSGSSPLSFALRLRDMACTSSRRRDVGGL